MPETNLEPLKQGLRKRNSSIALEEELVSRKAVKIETKDVKLIPDDKEEASDMDECAGRLKEMLSLKKKIKEERIIEDVGSGRLVEKNIESEAANIEAKGCLCGVVVLTAKCEECQRSVVEKWRAGLQ
jgi:hypothetical protein